MVSVNEKFESTLVVIPARGGSKRIPNKNIIHIYGQPMIYWPLAELSKLFNSKNVLVSTDSDEIKSMVETKGLKVPFKRPDKLSDDITGTTEVAKHALEWYEKNVRKVDYVLMVYPTAVLLFEKDICEAMNSLCNDNKCDSVMSATSFSYPIQRAVFENKNGFAEMFQPENYPFRSQDLIEAKHDAGQFYLSKVEAVRGGKLLTNSNVKLHLLNRDKVIDIDTLEDFDIAEDRLRMYKKDLKSDNWSFTKL